MKPHPVAGSRPDATAAPYTIKLLTRCTLNGRRWRVGAIITVPGDRLRVASHLVKTGAARPMDRHTEIDVALHQLLDKTLPR